jgi:transposase
MLAVTPHMKVLVAVEPADFRNGIDGLAQHCKQALGQDPFAGAVFCFRNRRGTAIKVLVYDGQGFWLCHKRLSKGRFRWWPTSRDASTKRVAAHRRVWYRRAPASGSRCSLADVVTRVRI